MLAEGESVTFTADELTWLSASTLIENHYALSDSPSSETGVRTLFQSVFNDSISDEEMGEDESSRNDEEPPSHLVQDPPPQVTVAASQTPIRELARTVSTTPGTNSPAGSSLYGSSGNVSSSEPGRQLITPPPTPPGRHLYPRYLSHEYPPSPSVSSSTLSSTSRPEWIYRTPKSSSLSRHRSTSANVSTSASCSPQLLRSPSISSRTYRDHGTPTRNYKHQYHAAAIPRPSSPVLISSTSQLVETPSLGPVSRSPSISSNVIGLRSAANASVSSLQSSIRVSPLKAKVRESPSPAATFSGSRVGTAGGSDAIAPQILERFPSNTSTMTNTSTGTAIWSALRGKSGPMVERGRILKSVPSRSQIISNSPVTPTFVAPSSSPLPISTRGLIPPKTPPNGRPVLGEVPPNLLQKHRDRKLHRRDKFSSAPPMPISTMGTNATMVQSSSSSIFGTNNPATPPSFIMTMGASDPTASVQGGPKSTTKAPSARSRNPRDRTPSLTSQCSTTTTHTAATTGTMSSSCSSRSHPDTPTTPLPASAPVPGVYSYRNSSNSSTNAPLPYLHGLGGEKGVLQQRHQRKTSTSSSTSTKGGNTAAAAAARSEAYAKLTRTGSARHRRPSTAPNSDASSVHSIPYSHHPGLRHGGSGVGVVYGNVHGHDMSASMPMQLSSSTSPSHLIPFSSTPPLPQPLSSPPPHLSSASLSHYGNLYVSQSPHTPLTPRAQAPHHRPSKAKSILTRTSSLSTKGSAYGGTVKSVKFVEVPEVYYRSDYYEQDGKEYTGGYDASNDTQGSEVEDDDDAILGVGAKGEGQEGKILREYMGIDVGAIDMDIDTYLGSGVDEEEKEDKEVKMSFRRKQGLNWNFLKGWREDKDKENRKGDEGRECTTSGKEQKKTDEKKAEEKTSSSLGLKRLIGIGRKTSPPSLSLSISSPFPLGLRSTTNNDADSGQNSKKYNTSPPASPSYKPAISGPYVLGSHLPSRSPPSQSPIASPSLHHTAVGARSIPTSSSNTSLSRLNSQGKRHYNYRQEPSSAITCGSITHRTKSIRKIYRSNTPTTAAGDIGVNTERPASPHVTGARPRGIVGSDVLGFAAVPLKNAPSYESFRSIQSYGGRSDVGSVKSARSAGGASVRSFKAWMNKVSVSNSGTAIAIAE